MATPDVSPPEAVDPPRTSALTHLASHLRLWPVAAAGLALDLWTKHWAFTRLPSEEHKGWLVIPHLTSLQRSLNTGALFGLGKGLTPLFIAASILALGFVIFLFAHSSRDRWSLHIGLALVLAGALGNLYDRAFMIADVVTYSVEGQTYSRPGKLLRQDEAGVLLGSWPEGHHPRFISRAYGPVVRQKGVVRDFIRMEPRITIGQRTIDVWPWVFNVADSLLVVGVGLLMLNFWRDRGAEKAAARQEPAPASPQA